MKQYPSDILKTLSISCGNRKRQKNIRYFLIKYLKMYFIKNWKQFKPKMNKRKK